MPETSRSFSCCHARLYRERALDGRHVKRLSVNIDGTETRMKNLTDSQRTRAFYPQRTFTQISSTSGSQASAIRSLYP
jgi:hypothetical protein